MKKNILFLIAVVIAVVAAAQPLSAQNYRTPEKVFWLDFKVAQHIGLNKWSDVGYVNDGLPATSVTEFRGTANYNLGGVSWLNLFLDMGVGVMPAAKMKVSDIVHMPMPNSGTKYYVREMLSESGSDGASAHFKIATGLFGEFKATDKLSVMPHLGVGGLTMQGRSYEMILKEEGSNMQYHTTCHWSRDNGEDYGNGSDMLGFFTGRLDFRYKIGDGTSLLLGLEYTHFFNSMNFYGRYTNTFNGNVRSSHTEKGNKMNMLGISVGLSFR